MPAFTVYDLRRWVRRVLIASVALVAGAVVLAYATDSIVFRVRVTNGNAYGAVVVSRYYAVAQKNGKTQFIFNPPAAQNCVNALFPHGGTPPCWYLRRHPEQRTDI